MVPAKKREDKEVNEEVEPHLSDSEGEPEVECTTSEMGQYLQEY